MFSLRPVSALLVSLVFFLNPITGCCIRLCKSVPVSHETAAPARQGELVELVSGNTRFALDLYRELCKSEHNIFFSPLSISTALAMTYAGAEGDVEREMASTLHFTLQEPLLHEQFMALRLALNARGESCRGQDGGPMRLSIANALWGQAGEQWVPDFLELLRSRYGSEFRTADFAGDPEGSRQQINSWVAQETEQKITDLLPRGIISALTRLILVNAVYFNAAWKYRFDEERTVDAPFRLLDGSEIMVPMMNQNGSFAFVETDTYKAAELPYDGGELSMLVVVPTGADFGGFEQSLDEARLEEIIEGLAEYPDLHVSIPRFRLESKFQMKETLSAMGMAKAFEETDFAGMDGVGSLFIQDVIHQAYVSVNEAGTEAAAATAVVMARGAAMTPQFVADRPFVFLIRDIPTGSVLFVGRVLNPLSQ